MIWKRATWAAAVMLMAALPSLAWWNWPTRLPHPDKCSQKQLYTWVALRDLHEEPLEVQRSLVQRFQDLLAANSISDPIDVDAKYRSTVETNRRLLQDLWFFDCVDLYHAMAADQRASFIDEQLQIAMNWQSMVKPKAPEVTATDRPSSISQAASGWIEGTAAEDRTKTLRVLGGATLRWLATYDLAIYSGATQEKIASEILSQVSHADTADAIPTSRDEMRHILPPDRERLSDNARLLLRAWFVKQARIYHAQDEQAHTQYVRDQVKTIRQSPFIPLVFGAGEKEAPPNPILLLMKVQQTINQWIREANETDRSRLKSFSTAVYGELIRGGLNSEQGN